MSLLCRLRGEPIKFNDGRISEKTCNDTGGNNVGSNKTVTVSPSSLNSQQTGTFIIRAPIADMKGTASFVRLEYESNP